MDYIGTMTDQMLVFDRRQVRRNRDRAAPGFADHDFLKREISERVADRMGDIQRQFPRLLDLGCHNGLLRNSLEPRHGVAQRGGPPPAAGSGGRAAAGPATFSGHFTAVCTRSFTAQFLAAAARLERVQERRPKWTAAVQES